jgi:hypothetical protein
MKNILNVKIQENNSIVLPKEMIKSMCILPGDTLKIEYHQQSIAERCFIVTEENEEQLFGGEWYCVPMRFLQMIGLDNETAHVLINEEELYITSTNNILSAIPQEFILALNEQKIDLHKIAASVVESVNNHILQDKE